MQPKIVDNKGNIVPGEKVYFKNERKKTGTRHYTKYGVRPKMISEAKKYEYFKLIELDGYPAVRAYAEAIDPAIYNCSAEAAHRKVLHLKTAWSNYDEMREMVRAERQDWNLKRSARAQEKAMELLEVTLDRAIELAKDRNSDAKTFNAAIQTLKTIMPAMTPHEDKNASSNNRRKASAEKLIH